MVEFLVASWSPILFAGQSLCCLFRHNVTMGQKLIYEDPVQTRESVWRGSIIYAYLDLLAPALRQPNHIHIYRVMPASAMILIDWSISQVTSSLRNYS